jgi:hypothetical protein
MLAYDPCNVAQFLLAHFRGLGGWRVDVDEFAASTPHGSKTFTNLVFTLDPYAPRRLVLAAHYDSKYFAQGRYAMAGLPPRRVAWPWQPTAVIFALQVRRGD